MVSSLSNAPSSQRLCVIESGMATTLPSAIISTNSRRNCGSGDASGRSRKAKDAYSSSVMKPSTLNIQPSLAKIAGLSPRPTETHDMSGIRITFMRALSACMSCSLMTPTHATDAPMPYCRNSEAMTLKLVSSSELKEAVMIGVKPSGPPGGRRRRGKQQGASQESSMPPSWQPMP